MTIEKRLALNRVFSVLDQCESLLLEVGPDVQQHPDLADKSAFDSLTFQVGRLRDEIAKREPVNEMAGF